jgi:hypothetical protein
MRPLLRCLLAASLLLSVSAVAAQAGRPEGIGLHRQVEAEQGAAADGEGT